MQDFQVVTRRQEDTGSTQPWLLIDSDFAVFADGSEQLIRQLTIYDNLSQAEEFFEDGNRVELIVRDALSPDDPDFDGLAPWTSIRYLFDANGEVETRSIIYDTGDQLDETYQNGALVSSLLIDLADQSLPPLGSPGDPGPVPEISGNQPWDTIFTEYDTNGNIASRTIDYDDGTQIIKTFDPGGTITSRLVSDGDSPLRIEAYESSALSQVTLIDGDGLGDPGTTHPWTLIQTDYDPDGSITGRAVTYDDGSSREEFFEDGVLRNSLSLDVGFDTGEDGANDWFRIRTKYHPDGSLFTRLIEYDDDTHRFDDFLDGRVMRTMQADRRFLSNPDDPENADGGQHPWSEIGSVFSETGDLMAQVVIFDNGVEREEHFETFTTSTVVESAPNLTDQVDDPPVTDQIPEALDPSQESVTVLRYRLLTDKFEDDFTGELPVLNSATAPGSSVQADSAGSASTTEINGVFRWKTIEMFFREDGVAESRFMTLDNGDTDVFLFDDDGVLSERQSIDNNGDAPWAAIRFLFDADGAIVDRIVYSDEDGVPDDFLQQSDSGEAPMLNPPSGGPVDVSVGQTPSLNPAFAPDPLDEFF